MALEDDDIQFIKKQYLFCAPIDKFRFTAKNVAPDKALDYDTQIKIFKNTIDEPGSRKYPSRLSYRIAFLRMLIEKAEKSGEDVQDKLYEALTGYMMLNDDASTVHYRHFLLTRQDTADRFVLQESKSLISEGTTGLRTWQAGFALAEWCSVNESRIRDKLVLELGSGVGLTGLSVVMTCRPKRYTFSDCHSSVLDMLVKNVRLNFARDESDTRLDAARTVDWNEESYRTQHRGTDVRVTRLDWSAVWKSDIHGSSWASPEVVLAADVVYDESLFDELIDALKVFRMRTKALVIVAATVRNDETIAKFINKLDEYGLSFEDETVPKPQLFLQCDETPVRIIRIFNKD